MSKEHTQLIKGVTILIMIMHHFLVMPFSTFPYFITLFGDACKICVAIYAVLSGYAYFFAKQKTMKYGLKKIWGLLKIYWLSLFTLFIPAAIMGGWKLTLSNLIVQLFGLLPNLNWFAWYVYFYIFCMLVMPFICRYKIFRFKPLVNFIILILVPYFFGAILHLLPWYETNNLVRDLSSCFMYFPCFLIGYWIAENKVIEKIKQYRWMNNLIIDVIGVIMVFIARILINSVSGFTLDVIYAPMLIVCLVCLFEKLNWRVIHNIFMLLGKYSTGMWFFHAVFFSTYVCDWFLPILKLISWPPLMFLWMVILSLFGAFIYQKILAILQNVFCDFERSI